MKRLRLGSLLRIRQTRTILHLRSTAPELLMLGLRGLHESADALSPLKSLTGGLLFLIETYQTVASNLQQAERIVYRVQHLGYLLAQVVPIGQDVSPLVQNAIWHFDCTVQEIIADLDVYRKLGWVTRIGLGRKYERRFSDAHRRIDESVAAFTLALVIKDGRDSEHILPRLDDLTLRVLQSQILQQEAASPVWNLLRANYKPGDVSS
ncbi:hypothetical protein FA95DRAFT_1572500 [Auriscalpium vulgare]|uniref:Uncharacterized protein n=1 Tax=Auriscalpium vulgare TaxID=40419 RepID=A0ACB8RUG2_9AGAM|nr:hypothetical protein FA95DRAFT_1572500 [Auriscalpium vulgare]